MKTYLKILLPIVFIVNTFLVKAQAHLGMSEKEIKAIYPNNLFTLKVEPDGERFIYSNFDQGCFYYYFDKTTELSYLCTQRPLNVVKMNGQIEIYNKNYVITSPKSWTAYFDNGEIMYIQLNFMSEKHISYFSYSATK